MKHKLADTSSEPSPLAVHGEASESEPVQLLASAANASQVMVEIHYPDPTPLSVVLRDVARWSGLNFVMESSTNTRVQIFAPRRQPLLQAYELFLAALAVANLRAVVVGTAIKIVPYSLPTAV